MLAEFFFLRKSYVQNTDGGREESFLPLSPSPTKNKVKIVLAVWSYVCCAIINILLKSVIM